MSDTDTGDAVPTTIAFSIPAGADEALVTVWAANAVPAHLVEMDVRTDRGIWQPIEQATASGAEVRAFEYRS